MIETIYSRSSVFSLALSHDETLLAYGGEANAPITLWNLSQGTVVSHLVGLKHQTHALAFSSDSSLIAAANLWGGLCVWQVSDGRLVDTKPETTTRKTRRLVYPEASLPARFPVMLSAAISRPVVRTLAPNGKFLAVSQGTVAITQYRRSTQLVRLDPSHYEVCKSGSSHIAWSANSQFLAVSGAGWIGVWLPFASDPQFWAQHLPFSENVDALGMLGESRQVLYARGREIICLDIGGMIAQPLLTQWQEFILGLPEPQSGAGFNARREWQWNITSSGYEGVHTYGDGLLWFSESYPAYAGGWGQEQSFASFLKDGPAHHLPEAMLIEVCQAVRVLTAAL